MTKCIKPDEIANGDLMAYVDGEAGESVRRHIEGCSFCMAQAARYRQVNQQLLTGFYRLSCPPSMSLVHWQLKLLPDDESLRVAAHARTCVHCTRELAQLDATDDTLLSTILAKLPDLTGWLEATLSPQPSGVRGLSAAQNRYQAGDLNILVGRQRISGRRQLRGRLYPTPALRRQTTGVAIWLVKENTVIDHQTTDKQGRFVFTNLASGRYDLGFGWQSQAILIRNVNAP